MKGYATLRSGGLTLRSPAAPTEGEIRTAVLPSVAILPLLQHAGSPARPCVEVGDRVREGMKIAEAHGTISASLHSSIPGVVISRRKVRLANGEHSEAVVVKLEGAFERLGRNPLSADEGGSLGRDDLLARLEELGLVSLDKQALPLHLLWRAPRGRKIERLLVSALDPEPLLGVESRLAVERAGALAEGLSVALRILEPRTVLFVTEQHAKGEAAVERKRLEEVCAASGVDFSQVFVAPRYPRSDYREILRLATKRRISPEVALSDLGIAATNVSTLVGVRDAVLGGKPLIERCVTVAGGAIREPATLRVRLGTRISDLIEECGGFRDIPERVVMGGPLTGSPVYDLETPVMKTTTAVLALTKREVGSGAQAPCISCGRCLTACPEGLNPTALFHEVDHGSLEKAASMGLMSCSECGGCSFVCPSHIPLLEGLKRGRQAFGRLEAGE